MRNNIYRGLLCSCSLAGAYPTTHLVQQCIHGQGHLLTRQRTFSLLSGESRPAHDDDGAMAGEAVLYRMAAQHTGNDYGRLDFRY